MSQDGREFQSWSDTMKAWLHPKAIAMLFLGFSAGLPILLIFATLSVWLTEAGVARSAVTFFSWAALGYSFKFIWAPLVDLLPLPLLTRAFGRRRGWLLVTQLLVITAICWMALVDPAAQGNQLSLMALAAVMLGFSSATQDIVIDAYRIESAEQSMQALLASMYIGGYRIGMLVAGAGSLFIASFLGTSSEMYSYPAWQKTYLLMAVIMGSGVLTTFLISEPETTNNSKRYQYIYSDYLRFLVVFLCSVIVFVVSFFYLGPVIKSVVTAFQDSTGHNGEFFGFLGESCRFFASLLFAGGTGFILASTGCVDKKMVRNSYVEPVQDFFQRYGTKAAVTLLLLVGFYRLSDIVLGVVSIVFYVDMGFSKNVIATISKTFGLGMTLLGCFCGGLLTVRFGVMQILFLGALLSSATNLLFMVLANSPGDVNMLTLVIGADNLSAGIATTVFIAFLSSLTNISFTASQYAIFSSIMTLFPKLIGGYSGTMVSSFGYANFFLVTAVIGIPVLILIYGVKKYIWEAV